MPIKREGTVIISTVIILSIMSFLGMILFKMDKNNNELSYLYNFQGDIYDFDGIEENELGKFMEELNNMDNEEKGVFEEDFNKKFDNSSLKYEKDKDKLILETKKNNNKFREREIKYILKNEKIVLVPTYKFNDE